MSIGNSCMFEGRITKDIDYSTFNVPDGQGGQRAVGKARFSIAVDRVLSKDQRQKVQNGDNSIKTVDFIPIQVTGSMVDSILKPYFFKGKGIRIRAHYTEWQQKDQQTGETKYGHSFEADEIGFCIQDPKGSNNNGNGNGNSNTGNAGPNTQGGFPNYGAGVSTPPQNNQPNQNSNFSMFDDDQQPF